MRQIEFRGKRVDNGEWIIGSETFIRDGDGIWLSVDCDVVKVDEETVGQFTGLLDKNGKEIYEGDILQLECFKVNTGIYNKTVIVSYEIKDCNDGTQWSWFTLNEIGVGNEYAFLRSKKMSIIGNIHDNKELLIEK